nr:hypothetical protein GCM10020092_103280 [Actinoplanes digitatis]
MEQPGLHDQPAPRVPPGPSSPAPTGRASTGSGSSLSAANINTPPVNQTLGEEVLVPYPIESALSGIMRHEDYMYYRKTFTVPG